MKPALRIDISAGSKNPDVGFYYIRGFKGEADLEPDIPPFSDKALEPVSNDSGDGIRLSGFIIPYEEGEKEVKLRLAIPLISGRKIGDPCENAVISGGGLICVKDMLKNVIAIACTKG